MPVDLVRAERVAVDLAGWAVRELVRSAGSDSCVVRTKANPADLVTPVDERIERQVRTVLCQEFPEYGVIGEELPPRSGSSDAPVWLIDPIDGTTNYAHGLGWSSFSLALCLDGRPLLGVVADPWRAETFRAVEGRGAHRHGSVLRVAPATTLVGQVLLTELAGHRAWPGMLALLSGASQRYCTVRIMGSSALALTQVGAGRAAAAVLGAVSPIDTAAGRLIAFEAGAIVLGHSGAAPRDGGGLVVAAPGVVTEVLRLLDAAHEQQARG